MSTKVKLLNSERQRRKHKPNNWNQINSHALSTSHQLSMPIFRCILLFYTEYTNQQNIKQTDSSHNDQLGQMMGPRAGYSARPSPNNVHADSNWSAWKQPVKIIVPRLDNVALLTRSMDKAFHRVISLQTTNRVMPSLRRTMVFTSWEIIWGLPSPVKHILRQR